MLEFWLGLYIVGNFVTLLIMLLGKQDLEELKDISNGFIWFTAFFWMIILPPAVMLMLYGSEEE